MDQRLILIRETKARTNDKHKIGLFLCKCGTKCEVSITRVRNGYTRSCGCIRKEGEAQKTHGMRGTPEYSSWQAMKRRCLVKSDKDYYRYGGVGITVYEKWADSFSSFFDHVGPRPEGTSLDRINNNIGYEPGNVRWATNSQQQRNRPGAKTWFIKGLRFETAEEAGNYFGVSKNSVWRWVNGSHDYRRGSFTPPKKDCYAIPRY